MREILCVVAVAAMSFVIASAIREPAPVNEYAGIQIEHAPQRASILPPASLSHGKTQAF